MKILINTATTHKGGAVQVARSFIEELKSFENNEYYIVLGQRLATEIDTNDFNANFTFYKIPYRPATKAIYPWYSDKFLNDIEERVKPDVMFTTSGPAYYKSKVPHLIGYNLPHYIYPESPYFEKLPFVKKIKLKLKGSAIKYFYQRDANAIVGQAIDVTQRASKWLHIDKTYTVTNTCNAWYFKNEVPKVEMPLREIDEFRLLYFSSYYEHKNFEIINEIAEINNGVQNLKFILTLPENIYNKIFTEKAKKIIYNIGPIPSNLGPSLYRQCDVLFSPSLLECFSANYTEAMATHTPIIAADLGFATSLCGEAAIYFKAQSAKDALNRINELSSNLELKENIVKKGIHQIMKFDTPNERANKIINVLKQLIK